MKIGSYQLNANASHKKAELAFTSIGFKTGQPSRSAPRTLNLVNNDNAIWSLKARERLSIWKQDHSAQPSGTGSTTNASNVDSVDNAPQTPEDAKLRLLEEFWAQLTGRKVSLALRFDFSSSRISTGLLGQTPGIPGETVENVIAATHFRYESEQVSYSAQGVVKTADGKEISVDVNMHMSREFAEFSQTTLGWAQQRLCDPLVINYGGTAASLTQRKYDFDLDGDGILDKISFAGAGSGFLALDKNGDGAINDGGELFGPGTGNGFGELRCYDKDGNGWIDENDDIFDQLRIWSKDENGNDQLYTLRELDIGAIYLGDVSTEFTMKDSANNTQGVMRSTSFFLRENGSAGTLSHIDLLV